MIIKWMPQAKESLRETAHYIGQSFGIKERIHFRQEIHYVEGLLRQHPNLGSPNLILQTVRFCTAVLLSDI
jgi:plasmid stabilization system protein ParE